MSTSVPTSFIRQYEQEVHDAYQRRGTLIRGTVRTANNVTGKSTTFQVIGKGTAAQKSRHGLVPVMNQSHTAVECSLSDFYAGDYVDKLDELKINYDERSAVARGGAMALGRKTDELITTAMDGASNSTSITLTSEATIRNSLLEACGDLYERDVPTDDGMVFGLMSPRMWEALMTVEQFASADYRGSDDLPFVRAAKTWLGVNWIKHSGLPLATNTRSCFIYHYDAVGHGIGSEVTADISWVGERAAHFINHMMSQGAVIIDDDGIQKITIDESTALPSS
jgi:hypothetical protein